MRNVLLTFALLLTFGMSFGQIKVVTNGNVGIGTSNPVAKLEVAGSIRISGPSDVASITGDVVSKRFVFSPNTNSSNSWSYFSMFGDESFTGGVPARAGELNFAGAYQIFRTGVDDTGFGVESMRLNGTGVGIGINAPAERLHVGGNILATGTVTSSDRRLKSGIQEYTDGLNKLMQIEPQTYNYNGGAGIKSTRKHVGLIAQDLRKISPELVGEYHYVEEDINRNIIFEDDYLYIDEGAIKYILVNSVKEQQAMIDAQNERIAQLEEAILNLTNGTSTQAVEIRDSRLGQNAPNPFTQATVINYAVPTKAQTAVMQVFDMNGQLLKSVNVANGNGQLTINAGELAAGTYSYNLVVDGTIVDTKKMILTK